MMVGTFVLRVGDFVAGAWRMGSFLNWIFVWMLWLLFTKCISQNCLFVFFCSKRFAKAQNWLEYQTLRKKPMFLTNFLLLECLYLENGLKEESGCLGFKSNTF